MNAGILHEIIDIYRVQVTINEYGERSEQLVKTYTTRANVSWDSGNRNDSNDEIKYTYSKTFRMRSYVPIIETDIIQWQNNKYRIMALELRRETNEIIAKTELIND